MCEPKWVVPSARVLPRGGFYRNICTVQALDRSASAVDVYRLLATTPRAEGADMLR